MSAFHIGQQLTHDFIGDVRSCAFELASLTLLGGGPDHFAIFGNKPDGRSGFVLAFVEVNRFVITDCRASAEAHRSSLHRLNRWRRPRAHLHLTGTDR